MSQILITVVHGVAEGGGRDFEDGLLLLAGKISVGIFTRERYIEEFESIYNNSGDVYRFSISDDQRYDNCERLLLPYWFCDCSEEIFANNMKKIAGVIEYCLKYSPKVELYVGTSGDQYDDFENLHIKLGDLHDVIKKAMCEKVLFGFDMTLHLVFERNVEM